MKYYYLILISLFIWNENLFSQDSVAYIRTIDINPPYGTRALSWVPSDLIKTNGTSTLTIGYEYWRSPHTTIRGIAGITVGKISDRWTFPSAIKTQSFHFKLGGELRKYARYYSNFCGVKLEFLPQFYSRENAILASKDYYFEYDFSKVRDWATTVSGIVGIRPKISNRFFADITLETGIEFRRVRHYQYEEVALTERPILESTLPRFVNNMLYDSNSKHDGTRVGLSLKLGFAIGRFTF